MTLRLIGLMSLVLLLSLAAFGLSMNRYQDQVMRELTETVSMVCRTTLGNFAPASDSPAVGDRTVFVGRREFCLTPRAAFAEITGTTSAEGRDRSDRQLETARLPCGSVSLAGQNVADTAPCTYRVLVDAIRAEEDVSQGLVLRIPASRADGNDTRVQSAANRSGELVSETGRGAPAESEIVLQVPTDRYRRLYSEFQRRSFVLFLGVFVIGTGLTAGLASHFTRPIRRLDQGIRQLSEGDLEVEVEASGRDEMARLGLAFNDMTRKLRIHQERSLELHRREKLSALGRLAAGVAHDVRNPLHCVGLTLRHLQDTCRPKTPGRAREFDRSIGIIRDEISRLDQLISNFLRFARDDRRDLRSVEPIELLRETAQLVGKEAERRGVALTVEVAESVGRVSCDVEAIRSSVLNLILNSFEALAEGGEVTLAARRTGDEIVIEVADNGTGIAEEHQERIFEFAYTTREGGFGLGLAMVHHYVVEEHGGRVLLSSRSGEGTRVLLAFPISKPGERGA